MPRRAEPQTTTRPVLEGFATGWLRALRSITRAAHDGQPFSTVAWVAIASTRDLLCSDRADVVLLDVERGTATVVADRSLSPGDRGTGVLPIGACGSLDTLLRGEVEVLDDLLRADAFPAHFATWRAASIRSGFRVPITRGGQLRGALEVGFTGEDGVEGERIALAADVARLLGLALAPAAACGCRRSAGDHVLR